MKCQIRLAENQDADAISRVITAALRQTNARDYPAEVIARVEQNFTAQAILSLMLKREVYVAAFERAVVATASLDGAVIRTVFVDPLHQRSGIGRQLMAVIESSARSAGLTELRVPSSITAQRFYASLGFDVEREEFYEGERTIIMRRKLEAKHGQSCQALGK